MIIENIGYGMIMITADENKSLQKISDGTICQVAILGRDEVPTNYIEIDKIEEIESEE